MPTIMNNRLCQDSATEKRHAKPQRVQPTYDGAGDPCCPVYRKPLAEGRYGLYCSAKAKGDEVANEKGYCALRFTEE